MYNYNTHWRQIDLQAGNKTFHGKKMNLVKEKLLPQNRQYLKIERKNILY